MNTGFVKEDALLNVPHPAQSRWRAVTEDGTERRTVDWAELCLYGMARASKGKAVLPTKARPAPLETQFPLHV